MSKKYKKSYDYLKPYAEYIRNHVDELETYVAQAAEKEKQCAKENILSVIREVAIDLMDHNYSVSPNQTVSDFLQYPFKSECMPSDCYEQEWEFSDYGDALGSMIYDRIEEMFNDVAYRIVKEKFEYSLKGDEVEELSQHYGDAFVDISVQQPTTYRLPALEVGDCLKD